MQTGAAYIRVSTEEQAEYSPDSQLGRIREYAGAHQILLPEQYIYLDEGISGRCARTRPAFMRMIAQAKEKPRPFDVILLWKFSRFARNRQDSILYKSMLRKECGIDVISITEQLSKDPTSILIEALLEAMDEYYSLNLAEEVRRGMNEKFSRGGVVSVPPFGYRMEEGQFAPDPRTAPTAAGIFRDFLSGLTSAQIAAGLNAAGIRTSRGNPFTSRAVDYILSNPVYAGKLRRRLIPGQPHMTAVQGGHLPLVSEDDFLAVQALLAARKQSFPPYARSSPTDFMLRGLVRCGNCGATLTQSVRGKYLQCYRYARGQCSVSHSVSLPALSRRVLEELEQDPLCPSALKRSLPALRSADVPENEKNGLLRPFISRIIFRRPENSLQIIYRTMDGSKIS